LILIILLWASLASTFIFAKKILVYSTPSFVIGTRMILAGSFLLFYQWFKHGKKGIAIKKEDLLTFFSVAIFHVYLVFMLEYWGLQYVSALKATIIFSSTPFITTIFAYFLLNQRLSVMKILGICIGVGGLVPTLILQSKEVEATMEWALISIPEVAVSLAVLSLSYAWFIVIRLMKKGYGLGLINGVAFLVGGIFSMLTAALTTDLSHPVSEFLPFIGWLLLLILVSNIFYYNLFGWLLKRYSVAFVFFSGFLSPCFGTLYDWLFMGGTLTWHYFASLGLITLGLYVFYREELKSLRSK